MADNKNSFTYKKYKRNKRIFRFISLMLVLYVLWVLWYYGFVLQNYIHSSIGLIIFSIITFSVILTVRKWERQNQFDKKWNYNTWGKGAGAELTVYNSLEQLPEGYKVIPDFNTGHGNIDFIVIGTKGIFTIEVKAHKGIIRYLNGKLNIDGKTPEKDYIRQTLAEKQWLVDNIQKHFNHFYKVTSLLEFTNGRVDTSTIHGPIDEIWIGGYKFHNYLINISNDNLSPEEINNIFSHLNSEISIGIISSVKK